MIFGISILAILFILLAIAISRIQVSSYDSEKIRKEITEQEDKRIERITRAKKTVKGLKL